MHSGKSVRKNIDLAFPVCGKSWCLKANGLRTNGLTKIELREECYWKIYQNSAWY